MTAEERIQQLEAENAALREQLAEALEHLGQALRGIHEFEGQLAKDSHNSGKPPSGDGPGRRRWSQRDQSEKPTGGQPGHAGRTLMQVAPPDEVVCHRPVICGHCQLSMTESHTLPTLVNTYTARRHLMVPDVFKRPNRLDSHREVVL